MHSIQTLTALLLAAAGTLAQNDDIAGQYYYSTSGCVQNPGPSNTNITLTRGAVNTCPLISAASQPAVTLPRIVSEKTFLVTNSSCQVCYYTDAHCSQPANGDGTSGLLGVLGQCEQLGAPLVSTKVICP